MFPPVLKEEVREAALTHLALFFSHAPFGIFVVLARGALGRVAPHALVWLRLLGGVLALLLYYRLCFRRSIWSFVWPTAAFYKTSLAAPPQTQGQERPHGLSGDSGRGSAAPAVGVSMGGSGAGFIRSPPPAVSGLSLDGSGLAPAMGNGPTATGLPGAAPSWAPGLQNGPVQRAGRGATGTPTGIFPPGGLPFGASNAGSTGPFLDPADVAARVDGTGGGPVTGSPIPRFNEAGVASFAPAGGTIQNDLTIQWTGDVATSGHIGFFAGGCGFTEARMAELTPTVRRDAAVAGLLMCASPLLFVTGLRWTSAVAAAAIDASSPAIAVLMATVLGSEKPSLFGAIAVLLTILGNSVVLEMWPSQHWGLGTMSVHGGTENTGRLQGTGGRTEPFGSQGHDSVSPVTSQRRIDRIVVVSAANASHGGGYLAGEAVGATGLGEGGRAPHDKLNSGAANDQPEPRRGAKPHALGHLGRRAAFGAARQLLATDGLHLAAGGAHDGSGDVLRVASTGTRQITRSKHAVAGALGAVGAGAGGAAALARRVHRHEQRRTLRHGGAAARQHHRLPDAHDTGGGHGVRHANAPLGHDVDAFGGAHQQHDSAAAQLFGAAMCVAGTVVYVAGLLMQRRLLATMPVPTVLAAVVVPAFSFATVFFVATGSPVADLRALVAAAMADGVSAGAIGYAFFFQGWGPTMLAGVAMQRSSAVMCAMYTAVVPGISAVVGQVALDEETTASQWSGIALVVCGVAVGAARFEAGRHRQRLAAVKDV